MSDSFITVFQCMKDESIAKNGSANYTIDQKRYCTEGFFSAQIQVESTGVGTVTVTYACSNDGVNFVTPVGASALWSTFGKTDGSGSDGKDLQSFEPPVAHFLRIIVTEDDVAAVVVNLDIAVQ